MNTILHLFRLNRKDLGISIVAGLVIAGIIIATHSALQLASASQPYTISSIAASMPKPSTPLTAQSNASDVLGLMLNSHTQWKTLNANATTIWNPGNNPQTVYSSIQIRQPSEVRLYLKQFDSDGKQMNETTWMSDGQTIHQEDILRQVYTEYPLPGFANSADDFGPQSPPEDNGNLIVRHPISMLIPSPLADYIYPIGLMQRQGTIRIEGTDQIASHDTIVILWSHEENGRLSGKARYWVDTYTGLILKVQAFGGKSWDDIAEETTITSITYNEELSNDIFTFQPMPGSQPVSLNEYLGR